MGFDSHVVYILFGVQIPNEDKEIILTKLKCETTRPKQRKFNIPDSFYYFIQYRDIAYISLSSIPFGLGENDGVCEHTKIIPPTQEQVDTFKFFIEKLDINYPYEQFFLPY